jgi:hypothetical protein
VDNDIIPRRLVSILFPGEKVLVDRLELLDATLRRNAHKMGKNKDYKAGYDIGSYLANEGEELDVKDIDQVGSELLEENDWSELPVTDEESFKEGLLNGYAFNEEEDEEEEE